MDSMKGVIEDIIEGKCDEMLDTLYSALRLRRKSISNFKAIGNMISIKKGDYVELTSIRPKYLTGLRCLVVSVHIDTEQFGICIIEDDKPFARKYANGIDIRVPATSVRIVSKPRKNKMKEVIF